MDPSGTFFFFFFLKERRPAFYSHLAYIAQRVRVWGGHPKQAQTMLFSAFSSYFPIISATAAIFFGDRWCLITSRCLSSVVEKEEEGRLFTLCIYEVADGGPTKATVQSCKCTTRCCWRGRSRNHKTDEKSRNPHKNLLGKTKQKQG